MTANMKLALPVSPVIWEPPLKEMGTYKGVTIFKHTPGRRSFYRGYKRKRFKLCDTSMKNVKQRIDFAVREKVWK